MVKAERV